MEAMVAKRGKPAGETYRLVREAPTRRLTQRTSLLSRRPGALQVAQREMFFALSFLQGASYRHDAPLQLGLDSLLEDLELELAADAEALGVIRDPSKNTLIDTHLLESIAQVGEDRAPRAVNE